LPRRQLAPRVSLDSDSIYSSFGLCPCTLSYPLCLRPSCFTPFLCFTQSASRSAWQPRAHCRAFSFFDPCACRRPSTSHSFPGSSLITDHSFLYDSARSVAGKNSHLSNNFLPHFSRNLSIDCICLSSQYKNAPLVFAKRQAISSPTSAPAPTCRVLPSLVSSHLVSSSHLPPTPASR
jgi:hypothetical protein